MEPSIDKELILRIDSELIDKGVLSHQRPLKACQEISDKLGIPFSITAMGNSILVDKVHEIYGQLYRSEDLIIPPVHVGCCLFRDLLLEIRIPCIYGTAAINPISFLNSNTVKLQSWLFSEGESAGIFYDQCIDLFDFSYGLDDLSNEDNINAKSLEYWLLAKSQLEGVAATATVSFDKYTVIQNCLYSVELLFKGGLFQSGYSEEEIRSFQHNLPKLSKEVSKILPKINSKLLQSVCDNFPSVIKTRYESQKYTRIQVGRILMSAQFIAGEVLRQYSKRDLRADLMRSSNSSTDFQLKTRVFPQ